MMKMHNEGPSDRNYRRTNRNWLDVRRTLMDNLLVDFIYLISYFSLFSLFLFKFSKIYNSSQKERRNSI